MPGRPTVIVIDDDPAMTAGVLRALRSFNVDVIRLDRVLGSLNAIAQHKPALVIMDVMMPAIAGTELTTLIRNDPELSKTPVLLHSALDETVLARKAQDCGADGYLLKTAGPGAMQRKLTRWLPASV